MEISLNAKVVCTDGEYGSSVYVLINPILEEVTHLVVKADSSPNKETIVPMCAVSANVAGQIQLTCSKAELELMDEFVKTRFVKSRLPDYGGYRGYESGAYFYFPYVKSEFTTVYRAVEDLQIPEGEMAIQRGTRVKATDGFVGKVDELVVNPDNGRITHLVMREGHLWGKKEILIPLSALGESSKDAVALVLTKQQVEDLPTFPVHRHWENPSPLSKAIEATKPKT